MSHFDEFSRLIRYGSNALDQNRHAGIGRLSVRMFRTGSDQRGVPAREAQWYRLTILEESTCRRRSMASVVSWSVACSRRAECFYLPWATPLWQLPVSWQVAWRPARAAQVGEDLWIPAPEHAITRRAVKSAASNALKANASVSSVRRGFRAATASCGHRLKY